MGYSPHNTCWPICQVGSGFSLEDRRTGERISWQRNPVRGAGTVDELDANVCKGFGIQPR
jgi:hypothetical protein